MPPARSYSSPFDHSLTAPTGGTYQTANATAWHNDTVIVFSASSYATQPTPISFRTRSGWEYHRKLREELEKFKAAMLLWAEQRAERTAEAIALQGKSRPTIPTSNEAPGARDWFVHRQRCPHRRGQA